MSLTTFIQRKNVKKAFQKSIPDLKMNLKVKSMKVPAISKQYGLIGTAFDYLIRFAIKKRKRRAVSDDWIADHARDMIMHTFFRQFGCGYDFLGKMYLREIITEITKEKVSYLDKAISAEIRHHIRQCLRRGGIQGIKMRKSDYRFVEDDLSPKLCHRVGTLLSSRGSKILRDAKNAYRNFLNKKKDDFTPDKEMIRAAVGLAMLDACYRAGSLAFADYKQPSAAVMKELQALYNIFLNSELWGCVEKGKRILLNPSFKNSKLVSGADCDLVIDDAIIEIKTSQRFQRKVIYQLYGYYWLWRRGGFAIRKKGKKIKEPRIRRLVIYFARYGRMWSENILSLTQRDELSKLLRSLSKETKVYQKFEDSVLISELF